MNPIEAFLLWSAGCFVGGFVIWLAYDIRSEKQQKRIAKLERDLALADFKLERIESVKAEFEKECG